MKGNISYSNEGAFSEDKTKGVIKLASVFLKNLPLLLN